ncbi:ATPase [Sphingomonas sp.]|uniref:F0F1 ATP synthase subunit B family protein n=1 Tax=Sphingomonas sp. TaxID=28214 RepID=UPI00286AC2B0|nr:ATPase [Sphingomonas sp.]
MPQLNQLSDVILSQLFWLAITLGFIYFVIGRGMVPRIQSTVDKRDQQIADDLAAAELAKFKADETEVAYRQRMDASRAEAMKITAAAKQEATRRIEQLVAKANTANQAKLEKAEARIRSASAAARVEIAGAAAEMTQEVVAKVAGIKIGKEEALKAVEAVHG